MAQPEVDEVYKKVAAKIQGMEVSKVLPRLLAKMMTPEQARMAVEFPATPEELAAKLGWDMKTVKKELDYMYRTGLGTPSARSGKWNLPRNYVLLLDKVGSHGFNFLPFWGPEYLDLWDEFADEMIPKLRLKDGKFTPPERFRVIPTYKAVKGHPDLQPWEDMRSILNMADKIALTHCACVMRTRKTSFPMHTSEVCFLLNKDAEYAVNSGAGRYLTVDEAIKVVENCEDAGVVHTVYNVRAIVSLLCNCRPDVCVAFKYLRRFGNADPKWFHPSRYLSVIDEKKCNGCGECVKWCLFSGIRMEKNAKGEMKAVVDKDKCNGAGICVIKCPQNAITMKCIRPEDFVPKGLAIRDGETRDDARYDHYRKTN
jgi:Na+-translocating ferredoxin:NAD+ oxidoreductase subunit B